MKVLALLALLPAIFAIPSPEAYNPFLAPPLDLSSSKSNNPISHGALNSRNILSSVHASGQQAHLGQKNRRIIKKSTKVKRANATCKPRDVSSSSAATSSSSSAGTASPSKAGTTTQGQATVRPTTSSTSAAGTVRPTTSPAKSTAATKTSTAATPAKTNFTVDPDGNGPFIGQATWYGSCGIWHKNWQPTVALSRELMDNWPGYNGLNPNNNPICGQRLQLNYQGKTLIAEVQDTCPSCTKRWIDVSQGVFEYFAATSVGMLGIDGYTPGFTWQWVDRNTPLTVLPH